MNRGLLVAVVVVTHSRANVHGSSNNRCAPASLAPLTLCALLGEHTGGRLPRARALTAREPGGPGGLWACAPPAAPPGPGSSWQPRAAPAWRWRLVRGGSKLGGRQQAGRVCWSQALLGRTGGGTGPCGAAVWLQRRRCSTWLEDGRWWQQARPPRPPSCQTPPAPAPSSAAARAAGRQCP